MTERPFSSEFDESVLTLTLTPTPTPTLTPNSNQVGALPELHRGLRLLQRQRPRQALACLEHARVMDLWAQGGGARTADGAGGRRALEIQPRVRIRLNLATAHSQLGEHAAALGAAGEAIELLAAELRTMRGAHAGEEVSDLVSESIYCEVIAT